MLLVACCCFCLGAGQVKEHARTAPFARMKAVNHIIVNVRVLLSFQHPTCQKITNQRWLSAAHTVI